VERFYKWWLNSRRPLMRNVELKWSRFLWGFRPWGCVGFLANAWLGRGWMLLVSWGSTGSSFGAGASASLWDGWNAFAEWGAGCNERSD
jgi:hypothetical protein